MFYRFSVRLGAHDLRKETEETRQDIPIARSVRHPQHIPNTRTNDIGILKLVRDVQFSGKLLKRLFCLIFILVLKLSNCR